MSEILEQVGQRTDMAGQNRMEMLQFSLDDSGQLYGINVFKVREALLTPRLSKVVGGNSVIKGIAHLRGQPIPIIDLSLAVGGPALEASNSRYVIVTEYNRSVQGFLVNHVESIINIQWEDVLPPPSGMPGADYLTAIARLKESMVQIIDVERVLADINRDSGDLNPRDIEGGADGPVIGAADWKVLAVDDSVIARHQIKQTVEDLGLNCVLAKNGVHAWEKLEGWQQSGEIDDLLMVISDIEMPQLDGYTLAKQIKNSETFSSIYVMLHSSLSGVFNETMIEKVNADKFLPKFSSSDLAEHVKERLAQVS